MLKQFLIIHKEFFKVAQKFFNNDENLITSVNKTCTNFINNNVLTEVTDNARKSAELLARYCDVVLRKGSKVEKGIEIEEKFYQIMIVFNYIKDKDVFEKFYYKMLAKRLIDRLSLSNDYEELMKLNLFIIVSIYQMAALLLFNKLLSWIVDQIQDETQIKIDLFFQVLYSLLKSKLITCYEINKNQFDEYFNESCIKMNYIIHINENFQSLKKNILFLIRNRE
ncbi:unnamed protein product [Rotaria sp. Silwood1]|nr:unnamed protein product [Rotaria sp. Silwood1]